MILDATFDQIAELATRDEKSIPGTGRPAQQVARVVRSSTGGGESRPGGRQRRRSDGRSGGAMPPTIADVARAAGVSVADVSPGVNGNTARTDGPVRRG